MKENGQKDIAERTVADNSILTALRGAARKIEVRDGTASGPMTLYAGQMERDENRSDLYKFDSIIGRLYKDLKWFEDCLMLASESFEKQSKKQNSRGQNPYEWGFFIELCNIFYKNTGEKPEARENKNDYAGERSHSGRVLDFLELCYQGFGLSVSRGACYTKVKKLNSGFLPRAKYGLRPAWLE